MIEAYRQQLERCYKGYLKATIWGEPFLPITLRGEKAKPASTADLQKAVGSFLQYEKNDSQKGWKIEWMDWSSKIVGKQKWISKIWVETEEDFLYLLKKEEEAAAFKQRLQLLLNWNSAIRPFLAEKPGRVLGLKEAWNKLQQVTDYLLSHDVSHQYIRSIPVPVHTKFIEAHKPTLVALLKTITPDKFPSDALSLEHLLKVQLKPHLFLLRWLDSDLAVQRMHGMEFTGVSVNWLKGIDWSIKEIWLVENETNLYLVPPRQNAIAIFSKGYAMSQLKDIPLFRNAKLYYWGDLDEDGYKMLNAMRTYYPPVISLFMDERTLIMHSGELVKQESKYKTTLLPLLTRDETAAFNILIHHNGRLEQERIRQDFIAVTLANLDS